MLFNRVYIIGYLLAEDTMTQPENGRGEPGACIDTA